MKRIIFVIVFGVLLVGGVIALTSLSSDSLRVEKVNDTYSVYVLKEQKTGGEIQSELDGLAKAKQSYFNEIYPFCVENCPGWCEAEAEMLKIKYNPECINECSFRCGIEKDYLIKQADDKITELNVILSAK